MPQNQKFVYNKEDNNSGTPAAGTQSSGFNIYDILGSAAFNVYMGQASNWAGDFKTIYTETSDTLEIPNITSNAFDFIILNPSSGSCAVTIDLTKIGTEQLSIGQVITIYNSSTKSSSYEILGDSGSIRDILPGEVIRLLIQDGTTLLPIGVSISSLNSAGEIAWGIESEEIPYAVKMSDETPPLVKGELVNGAIPDQLIKKINSYGETALGHGICASPNTLIAFPPDGALAPGDIAQVNLKPGAPTIISKPWVSHCTTSTITYNPSYNMGVYPEVIYENGLPTSKLKMTWIDNGETSSGMFRGAVGDGFYAVSSSADGNLTPVLMNGYFAISLEIIQAAEYLARDGEIHYSVGYKEISVGSVGTPASIVLDLTASVNSYPDPKSSGAGPIKEMPIGILNNSLRDYDYNNFYIKSNYYQLGDIDPPNAIIYPINYLGWVDGGVYQSPGLGSSIGTPYKYVVSVLNDDTNDYAPAVPVGGVKKVVSLPDSPIKTSPETICQLFCDSMTSLDGSSITFTALPANGEYDELSIQGGEVTWIYWNTTTSPTPPENPVIGSIPVLISYESTTTGEEFQAACIAAHNEAFCGVPTYRRMFNRDAANPDSTDSGLAAFMYL